MATTSEDLIKKIAESAMAEKRRLERLEEKGATVDAQGLVLLAPGIVLTALSDKLAELGWVGWLAFALSAMLLVAVVASLIIEQLARQDDAQLG